MLSFWIAMMVNRPKNDHEIKVSYQSSLQQEQFNGQSPNFPGGGFSYSQGNGVWKRVIFSLSLPTSV